MFRKTMAILAALLLCFFCASGFAMEAAVYAVLDEIALLEQETAFLSAWTDNDKETLAAMVGAHGLAIGGEDPEAIWKFGENVLLQLVKDNLGPWEKLTIAQRAALREKFEACRVSWGAGDMLPDPEDISMEQALQLAQEALNTYYGISPEGLARTVSFVPGFKGKPVWSIVYLSDIGGYSIEIDPKRAMASVSDAWLNGEALLQEELQQSQEQIKALEKAEDYFSDIYAQKGDKENWSLQERAQYDLLLKAAGVEGPYNSLPADKDIPKEEAQRLALDWLKSNYCLTDAQIQQHQVNVFFFCNGNTSCQWQISFEKPDRTGRYTVCLDSVTGEILEEYGPNQGNG